MEKNRFTSFTGKMLLIDNPNQCWREIHKKTHVGRPLVIAINSGMRVRRGNWWSKQEIEKAEIDFTKLKKLGLRTDKYRKTVHDVNIVALKELARVSQIIELSNLKQNQ